MDVSIDDRIVLRALASRLADAAISNENIERKNAWYLHDEGSAGRPMVLAEIQGIRDDSRPIPEASLDCTDPWARTLEHQLRHTLYEFEILKDDHVVEPFINVNWDVTLGDFGVQAKVYSGDREGKMGSVRWDPPIVDLDRDFSMLRMRDKRVDREKTAEEVARYESIFDGVLPVRIRGTFYWTTGLTWRAIDLIGLEGLMLAMYDNPSGLHRLMGFLRDDHLAISEWLEAEGLYSYNNENDYIGSGSMGYSRALPGSDGSNSTEAKMRDLWVLSESQETVGVGPDLFEEFVFPYQQDIVRRFGKCYYGCCEPLDGRWHIIERLPTLERVSVSPWADEEFLADRLGDRYVYSRKPAPSMISARRFDEDEIRADLRKTLDTAANCRVEIIMKDVHTLNNQPERLTRWVELAREEISRAR